MEETTTPPTPNPLNWAAAMLPLVGGALAAYALMRMKPEVDSRAVSFCAAAYEMLGEGLAAVHAGSFGLARIAFKESERVADAGLALAGGDIQIALPDVTYDGQKLIVRHLEDAERVRQFLARAEPQLQRYLTTHAPACVLCQDRVATDALGVCAQCRADACEALAPPDALAAYLAEKIAAAAAEREKAAADLEREEVAARERAEALQSHLLDDAQKQLLDDAVDSLDPSGAP
jgi:hypothetical protein